MRPCACVHRTSAATGSRGLPPWTLLGSGRSWTRSRRCCGLSTCRTPWSTTCWPSRTSFPRSGCSSCSTARIHNGYARQPAGSTPPADRISCRSGPSCWPPGVIAGPRRHGAPDGMVCRLLLAQAYSAQLGTSQVRRSVGDCIGLRELGTSGRTARPGPGCWSDRCRARPPLQEQRNEASKRFAQARALGLSLLTDRDLLLLDTAHTDLSKAARLCRRAAGTGRRAEDVLRCPSGDRSRRIRGRGVPLGREPAARAAPVRQPAGVRRGTGGCGSSVTGLGPMSSVVRDDDVGVRSRTERADGGAVGICSGCCGGRRRHCDEDLGMLPARPSRPSRRVAVEVRNQRTEPSHITVLGTDGAVICKIATDNRPT